MNTFRDRSYENPNLRVASYESLLDLFTLLSFILIVAAFVFAARTSRGNTTSATFAASIAQQGSGTPVSPPKDLVLLIFTREGSQSRIVLFDGTMGVTTSFFVTTETIPGSLEQASSSLAKANQVQFAIPRLRQNDDACIILAVQEWLTRKGQRSWSITFY